MIPAIVYFEETDETRKVVRRCGRCERIWLGEQDFEIVSPSGTAHIGADYGETACGIDATGENWWWRL